MSDVEWGRLQEQIKLILPKNTSRSTNISISVYLSDADDFEPAGGTVPAVSDKWEGEDEDDDIKVKMTRLRNNVCCSFDSWP